MEQQTGFDVVYMEEASEFLKICQNSPVTKFTTTSQKWQEVSRIMIYLKNLMVRMIFGNLELSITVCNTD